MDKKRVTKEVLKFVKAHGFVLCVGLVTGHLIGEENLDKFLGGQPNWFWLWFGSYGLGIIVLFIAFIINRMRQQFCGKGEDE